MTDGTETDQVAARKSGFDLDAWIRPLCDLVVAGVAVYASYVRQREFALQGGADAVTVTALSHFRW